MRRQRQQQPLRPKGEGSDGVDRGMWGMRPLGAAAGAGGHPPPVRAAAAAAHRGIKMTVRRVMRRRLGGCIFRALALGGCVCAGRAPATLARSAGEQDQLVSLVTWEALLVPPAAMACRSASRNLAR